jgi:hypothetical protein
MSNSSWLLPTNFPSFCFILFIFWRQWVNSSRFEIFIPIILLPSIRVFLVDNSTLKNWACICQWFNSVYCFIYLLHYWRVILRVYWKESLWCFAFPLSSLFLLSTIHFMKRIPLLLYKYAAWKIELKGKITQCIFSILECVGYE